ncbi:amino acid permease (plasmid) [Haloferax mediterranei ATCC 33500]|uniref:Amino acid permease n=1 Tax=Haloferax mediterranei (strain ATCC 33500 / DSM 1411 / JCM 8866 / NBRC 14739 / NCIMB 2177 / R-4) TaxID=523841 RepID=I3R9Y6_HALMT|nr:amino acid permease [Haloferax mediterranei]AFK21046.1 putative cationic amino acid transport protein [Haloferax mediterranei ATCC 33500]AHZ24094.1 amino acid permease [Haloferax mediterranei ATCC 33500]EMA05169.1 putative cationic amino acid transport protein [Haloferax mediterranei ATCC 33500]MDX5989756.1 amino acid permease [Haloferax mediterranei ATCC 33500]QCQ77206.1 amino acid permease [Haloferax mediterranei ATCC 33500]
MVEHTRTLDFKIAFAIGLGTMIAAGIFSLSGTAVFRIGSSAVIAFVLAALVAGITAAAYSEFASIYSENGGGYLFCSRTFEEWDRLKYGVGMSLFLGYTGTTAFYLATMDEWFFRFILPESLQSLPHGSVGILAALTLGLLNARGTEESGIFQLIVTSAKVGVLFVFIGGAIAFAGPAGATTTFVTNIEAEPVGIVSVAALAFITFFGFSAIAASAGEIIEPRKTVPRAIAASMITVTVLYALVIVAMVNAPVAREVLAEGETAMGSVAASFLGPWGQLLIVAGAVFSMVSASNASILAASGIGSLMGRQGHAPRRFARIHRDYRTPFWSVTTATATICLLIFVFITLFSEHGLLGVHFLGLSPLTGFATFNLLVPLAVVDIALIYSRRNYPDIERGFSMPLVPALPVVGVLANLALILNLPPIGVGIGAALTVGLVIAYLVWGGAPHIEELVEKIVSTGASGQSGSSTTAATGGETEERERERFRVLVALARPERAVPYVRLAETLSRGEEAEPLVQVLNVTHIPDQTPNEMVRETAQERAERIEALLSEADIDVEYTVEGHICRDIAFDILQTARDDQADQILMGYPEENPGITETVEYNAPCGVFFTSNVDAIDDFSTINVGAGGGPHHLALLPIVNRLGQQGAKVHVISVNPKRGGTSEPVDETVSALTGIESLQVHNLTADTVAEGLVSTSIGNGGFLLIGATRDRRLRRWVFGSTPDRTIDLARSSGVPVLIHASTRGVSGRIEEYIFPIYRYLRRHLGRHRAFRHIIETPSETE